MGTLVCGPFVGRGVTPGIGVVAAPGRSRRRWCGLGWGNPVPVGVCQARSQAHKQGEQADDNQRFPAHHGKLSGLRLGLGIGRAGRIVRLLRGWVLLAEQGEDSVGLDVLRARQRLLRLGRAVMAGGGLVDVRQLRDLDADTAGGALALLPSQQPADRQHLRARPAGHPHALLPGQANQEGEVVGLGLDFLQRRVRVLRRVVRFAIGTGRRDGGGQAHGEAAMRAVNRLARQGVVRFEVSPAITQNSHSPAPVTYSGTAGRWGSAGPRRTLDWSPSAPGLPGDACTR